MYLISGYGSWKTAWLLHLVTQKLSKSTGYYIWNNVSDFEGQTPGTYLYTPIKFWHTQACSIYPGDKYCIRSSLVYHKWRDRKYSSSLLVNDENILRFLEDLILGCQITISLIWIWMSCKLLRSLWFTCDFEKTLFGIVGQTIFAIFTFIACICTWTMNCLKQVRSKWLMDCLQELSFLSSMNSTIKLANF